MDSSPSQPTAGVPHNAVAAPARRSVPTRDRGSSGGAKRPRPGDMTLSSMLARSRRGVADSRRRAGRSGGDWRDSWRVASRRAVVHRAARRGGRVGRSGEGRPRRWHLRRAGGQRPVPAPTGSRGSTLTAPVLRSLGSCMALAGELRTARSLTRRAQFHAAAGHHLRIGGSFRPLTRSASACRRRPACLGHARIRQQRPTRTGA